MSDTGPKTSKETSEARIKEVLKVNIRLQTEVKDETDRAVILIAAIMLESTLERLLIRKLLPSPVSEDSLFYGPTAPMGTFSAKIDLANRLGIIPDKASSALRLIKKIRNQVAHHLEGATFESIVKQDRVREVVNVLDLAEEADEYSSTFAGDEDPSRSYFVFVVACLLGMLVATEVERVDGSEAKSAMWGT